MDNKITAVKFGGSSLCDAKAIDRAAKIINADSSRRYVAVSAPGKRFPGDEKITDMLYDCYGCSHEDFLRALEKIKTRYDGIIAELSPGVSLDGEFEELLFGRKNFYGRDYFASRGEYFCAKILAAYLGYDFIDAAKCILFGDDGNFLAEKTKIMTNAELLSSPRAVIPGFYGSMPNGTIKTFERGGSDITGAIIAAACGASVYENWTDVSGFMSADPKTVDNPKTISIITYKEMRRLSYMGATVLHEDSVLPLLGRRIPILIKNTLRPDDPGTAVVPSREGKSDEICGIAGKRGFLLMNVCRERIGSGISDRLKILDLMSRRKIRLAGMYSGIDCIGLAIPSADIAGRADYIRSEICQLVEPEYVTPGKSCALIAIVGAAPQNRLADIFSAVASAGAEILCLDFGSGDGGVNIGVEEAMLPTVINSLYNNLIK